MTQPRTPTLWRTQHFLRDPQLIAHLVAQAKIGTRDVVYDLGAGTGNLTAVLARHAGRVVAIEKDRALIDVLRRRFAHTPNVVVREADVLKLRLPRADYVVFASIPFDISADVIRLLTSSGSPPRDAFLVLQRETALRFFGRLRTTLAALLLAPWFSMRVLHTFARSDFVPAPNVDTVFVQLHKRGPPLVSGEQARLYRDFVAASFSTRRSTVFGVLACHLGSRAAAHLVRAAAVDRSASPAQVGLDSWLRLFREFANAPAEVRARVKGASARLGRRQRQVQKEHRTRAPRDDLGATAPFPKWSTGLLRIATWV